jgi:hypothetical protein
MRVVTASDPDNRPGVRRRMQALTVALWALQALLAALFLWHGQFMAFPPAAMVAVLDASIGPVLRTIIGVAKLLAAAGLILPGLTRILPVLTPLAAAGLMVVMLSASTFHLIRGETASAISAAIILGLVSVVAYARWKIAPIAARRHARSAD